MTPGISVVSDRPAPAPAVAPALEVGDTLEIVVSPDDIAQGRREDTESCAFSLALRRAGYPLPSVGYCYVRVGLGRATFDHTTESQEWVRAFDNGEPVAPERFVLHRRKPLSD